MAGSQLPSGTVSFLFTDIEGSTKLLHELGPQRYAEALDRHRQVVRESCLRHEGVEVDTQGDAFFVAFPTAPGALEAAREAQEALAIPVRMGIHTGTPLLTGEGYVGTDVHKAARIAAAGHGRQILVSSASAALLGSDGLRDLGEHRLKDLSAPERIYQLGDGDFPPLKTLYRTNLPIPATPFIGRERELTELGEFLGRDDVRLLTLLGPGGTGKTRLALQAVAAAADRYPDGVFWVALAPLRDPGLVLEAASQALGATDGLADHVADKRLLLLFDNFEHIIDAAGELATLLGSCPNLSLVVTSRELLQLAAEQSYPVPPLDPCDSVQLFVARAKAVKPAFEPDEAVPGLCDRLDHLPLALELAAARVRILSPQQLGERLTERLDLLRAGRDADPRQQTLRTTIGWSYELLDEQEQGLFARLAVFRGGFTLEAAERITDGGLDTLQSLVDKSLLRQTHEGRFLMLETIREFALERLEESPDASELQQRHASWFLNLACEAEEKMRGPDEPRWLAQLEDELPNLRASLGWFEERGSISELQSLSAALWHLWSEHGHLHEGRLWLEQGLALGLGEPLARARALNVLCAISMEMGSQVDVRGLAEESDRIYGRLGDPLGRARSRTLLGWAAEGDGDLDEAQRLHEQSVELARSGGHPWWLQVALNNLGNLLVSRGEFDRAAEVLEEALGISSDLQFPDAEGRVLVNLALARLGAGDFERAGQHLHAAFTNFSRTSSPTGLSDALLGLAAVARAEGEPRHAARLLGAAELVAEQIGRKRAGYEAALRDETLAALEANLGQEALASLVGEGRALAREGAIALVVETQV
jgi:predicted ATPase/class 3 adenylate cyclase/Tfp pilus assembly protein PilF